MIELVPSIIGETFAEVEDKINFLDGKVEWAHLDIMDGRFAKSRSWSVPSDLDFVPGRIKLEAHLMVETPEERLGEWVRVMDRVIVHTEAAADLADLLSVFASHHTQLGLALLLPTPLSVLEAYLDKIKLVHLMSVAEIGYHGRPFEEKVLAKIKALRALSPSVTISVDGGLNLQNVEKVLAAGANRVVVGGAIWHAGDAAKNILNFQKLIAKS